MTEKEWNLSDMGIEFADSTGQGKGVYYHDKFVKEFIRRLKNHIVVFYKRNPEMSDYVNKEIDKLAGEKLC